MRYTPSLPLPPSPVEGEEPLPVRAIRPARPVAPRTLVPRVVQHFGTKAGVEGGAGGGPKAVRLVERASGDRREVCRRLQHGQSFLDTRSGEERRKHKRRDRDIVTSLDEEV